MENKLRWFLKCFFIFFVSLLLFSCKAEDKEVVEVYKSNITTRIFKTEYYASNYEKEGNDYYYINLIGDDNDTLYMASSIPSKYIVAIDAEYRYIFPSIPLYEFKKLKGENISRVNVELYEIGGDKPVKSIDIKKIIRETPELNKVDNQIYRIPFKAIAVDGAFYFGVDIAEWPTPKALKKTLYTNFQNEETMIKPRMTEDWLLARSRYVDIFSRKFLESNMENCPYVTTMYYWEDAVKLSFTTDKLPKNNKKLYEKFPDLKEKLEELEEKGLRARLEVVLTGKPSYEEIMELLMEEGREPVFEGIKISAEDSVDGEEHEVHSFDDWRAYYRLEEADVSLVSPIFPREY